MEVLYRVADGAVLGVGETVGRPEAGQAVRPIAPAQAAKLVQPGTKVIDPATGVVTVTPPPAPPATRPKNRDEWRATFGPMQTQFSTARTAFLTARAAMPAGAAKDAVTALGQAVDALRDAQAVLAKASGFLEPDPIDDVPNM